MKIVFRVIYCLLWIFLCFIIVNLVIWSVKYGWISSYAHILNAKDWQSSVSNISFSPKSWISIFYQDENTTDNVVEPTIQEPENVDTNIDTNTTTTKEVNRNPYDPDYEDEFNSFFGTKDEEKWQEIQEQTQEETYSDLEAPWFKLDE